MLYSYGYDSPFGRICITADEGHIKCISFGEEPEVPRREAALIKRAYAELREYYDGRRRSFDLPLAPEGTGFQKAVWQALCEIPYGETRSYGQVAESIGKPDAARAVGQACNRNPIAVMIPCHRVIGKNAELSGYAAGLSVKKGLLDLERRAAMCFEYGEREIEYLKSRDERMSRLIEKVGFPRYEVIPDLFAALAYNIMGQQISMKAVETVWRRMNDKFGEITPEKLLSVPLEELQGVGMSMRKASYIRDAAEKIKSGELDAEALKSMSDEVVCERLSRLRGIGRWTAEMLMIFSMRRPDILSFDDLGIRRAITRLYGLEKLDREDFEKYRRLFSPYGTVASFYLWALNDMKEGF